MLAELPVGNPRQPLLIGFKRERVNKNRFAVQKLHIVCAGILQAQAVLKSAPGDRECQNGSVFELLKTPLVRIGNEGDGVRKDYFISQLGQGSQREGHFLVRHERFRLAEPLVKPRLHQGIVGFTAGLVHLTIDDRILRENEPAGIAE